MKKYMAYFCSLYGRCGGKTVIRYLALLLALVVTTPVLLAEDGNLGHDRDHEPGKGNDLTGVWTQTYPDGTLLLVTFHADGTASADQQGDVVFNPVQSHEHGLWKKIGPRMFIASFAAMEYFSDPPPSPKFAQLYATALLQARYTLYPSGDQYDGTVVITETLPNGTVVPNPPIFKIHGVRLILTPPPL